MKENLITLLLCLTISAVSASAGYKVGWSMAEQKYQPDHQIVETQIGKIMIQNKKLYAIDEVHTLVVDPVLLNQLTARQWEKKK